MLKVRVIPSLLWKGVGLVKGIGFDSSRRVGSVLPAVKVYNSRDVDELVLVDITATSEARHPDDASVSEFAEHCFVPLAVGGGVRELSDIVRLLRAGADKVVVNTAAYELPELVSQAARKFGAQCIVASVDVRTMNGGYTCMSHCGTRDSGRCPVSWARELEARGVGEILLTSIDRDGTMMGYDLALIESVTKAVNIPVIASGGAGSYQHMVDAVQLAGASAVAAASLFHFTEQTPAGAKVAMRAAGIPVRSSLPSALPS